MPKVLWSGAAESARPTVEQLVLGWVLAWVYLSDLVSAFLRLGAKEDREQYYRHPASLYHLPHHILMSLDRISSSLW